MTYRAFIILLCAMLVSARQPVMAQKVVGAGATFPDPIYEQYFIHYLRIKPEAILSYEPVGSEEGIRRLLNGQLDYAGSDWPLSRAEAARIKGGLLQFPTVLGAVVPIYSVSVSETLRFTPAVLAGIFSGRITMWNDPAIQSENRNVYLPVEKITVVHRSDGSGTTLLFTRFLSAADPDWADGTGFTIQWFDASIPAKSNNGVAQTVKQTANAIGYVEWTYAVQHRLDYGYVQNKSGHFIHADIDSIAEAVPDMRSVVLEPTELAASILNSNNVRAYPISAFTWLLVPVHIPDAEIRKTLIGFLEWMFGSGQLLSAGDGYCQLPRILINRNREALKRIGP